ncbi:MAG: LAGLIDADG family homing endonuclease [Patescibacteria group bacterium]
MDYSLLKYPKKSHRKIINIPNESKELAELFGIIFGDGGINNDWQLVITLNSNSDLKYSQHVDKLLRRLFKIDVHIRKRPSSNALVLVSSGSNLVDFLVNKGAVRGDKIVQQIDIPNWIDNNPKYQKAFVRGCVDTDGCLFVHHHTVKNRLYHNVGFCFTNSSEKLIISVAEILKEFGINPHITDEGRRIYLYSVKSVTSYLDVFGSSNPRILNKYLEWLDVNESKSDNINKLHLQNRTRRGVGVV